MPSGTISRRIISTIRDLSTCPPFGGYTRHSPGYSRTESTHPPELHKSHFEIFAVRLPSQKAGYTHCWNKSVNGGKIFLKNELQNCFLRSADILGYKPQAFPFEGKATGISEEIKRASLPWMGCLYRLKHPSASAAPEIIIDLCCPPSLLEGRLPALLE